MDPAGIFDSSNHNAMATQRQLAAYRDIERKFGRTREFLATVGDTDIERLDPLSAYSFIGRLIESVRDWRYQRLPRSAGLPQDEDERCALYARARIEERIARIECPDDEREHWCADNRPPAMGTGRSYFEQNPELLEALEIDGYYIPRS